MLPYLNRRHSVNVIQELKDTQIHAQQHKRDSDKSKQQIRRKEKERKERRKEKKKKKTVPDRTIKI